MVNADRLGDYDGIAKHAETCLTNGKTFKDAAGGHRCGRRRSSTDGQRAPGDDVGSRRGGASRGDDG
eukprot:7998684-Pyramimonas_sp.AAC.1